MSLVLIAQITAGTLAILAGVAAAAAPKGRRLHRRAGAVFVAAMLMMSGLGAGLALFAPPIHPGGAPPQASATIAVLTAYLVATGWVTARRREPRARAAGGAGRLRDRRDAAGAGRPGGPRRSVRRGGALLRLAALAAGFGSLDLRVAVRGGLAPPDRVARHLWRMMAALFFATAFFFLGQQKAMPVWMRGSPLLTMAALAPLPVMAAWLLRIWASVRAARQAPPSLLGRMTRRLSFRARRGAAACAS